MPARDPPGNASATLFFGRHNGGMALLIDEPAAHLRDVGVVRVSGPDRLSYLQTQLSQHFQDAKAGTVADFLYLDAKGNPLAAGRGIVGDEAVLLVTPSEIAADFAGRLEQFKFLLDVEAADVSSSYAVASVRGPDWIEAPGAAEEPLTAVADGDGQVIRDRSGGVDVLGPDAWVRERVAQLNLPEASAEDWEAWRVHAAEPSWGTEIDTGRRPQDLGLLPTHVHLQKGCYPGQEAVAKQYNLGRPRKALALARFDGPVAAGDELDAGGKGATVTSAAQVGDGWEALVVVPLDKEGEVRGGGELAAESVSGTVIRRVGEGLPIPGA